MSSKHERDAGDTLVQTLKQAGVATITAILLRRGLRNQYMPGLLPVSSDHASMAGPAFTLRFIPAREDVDTLSFLARTDNVHRRAIEECPPGSVLVIDARGTTTAASAGDLMIRRLGVRGCAGIVTDGGFRDTAGIAAVGLPAYQLRPACCASPVAHHPVDLDQPVACAGVAVYPGDMVVGDTEGVVVIPAAIVGQVAGEASEAAGYELFAESRIAEGGTLFDVFPPTERSMAEFRRWQSANAEAR
jgi:regulator of RNase E activity RraA